MPWLVPKVIAPLASVTKVPETFALCGLKTNRELATVAAGESETTPDAFTVAV